MTSPECPLQIDEILDNDDEPHPLQSLIDQTTERETASDLQADLLERRQRAENNRNQIAQNMRKYAGNRMPKVVLPVAA